MLHRGLQAVAGDSDEAHESRVPSLDRRAQRAVRRERGLPLGLVHQVVQLDEVDAVRSQALQREADLVARLGVRALAGLRREEEAVAPRAGEPGRHAKLGIAIARGGVDVVHAMTFEQFEHAVRDGLRYAGKGRRAEERASAPMTGAAERRERDHTLTIPRSAARAPGCRCRRERRPRRWPRRRVRTRARSRPARLPLRWRSRSGNRRS